MLTFEGKVDPLSVLAMSNEEIEFFATMWEWRAKERQKALDKMKRGK